MSLESLPSYVADFTGLNEFTSQIILSLVVIFMLIIPVAIVTKGKNSTLITILMFFFGEAFCVGAGWLPAWIMIATVAVVAMAVASLGTDVITGE